MESNKWWAVFAGLIAFEADLRYERLNMPVIETSIDKAWGFSTDFFHTLIKQRPIAFLNAEVGNPGYRGAHQVGRAVSVQGQDGIAYVEIQPLPASEFLILTNHPES